MLKSLRIDNFAIIDKVELEFKPGFTVLTGETGSGKSILLSALNLLMGDRADYSIIGPNKDKAIVEAEIDISGFGLRAFFDVNEVDYAEKTILRREIYREGRSRAFINDVPVQLIAMRDLGSRLIHIHSQYNTLELKDRNYQLELLDILAGTASKRDVFSKNYSEIEHYKVELAQILDRKRSAEKEREFNLFQLNELESASLDKVNYSELEERNRLFESGDELRSLFGELISLSSLEENFPSRLNEIKTKLIRKREISPSIEEFIQRIDTILVELKELSADAESELERINIDPLEMEKTSGLLDVYNRLLFKYKCKDQTELSLLQANLQKDIAVLDTADNRILELEELVKSGEKKLTILGEELHTLRSNAAKRVEQELLVELEALKLPECKLIFELEKKVAADRTGISELTIMFSPNPGMPAVPIQKAASGGELSRVMLALQHLISQKTLLQTILFDEIDTGVSGDVAARIGQTLLKMGERMQVLAITHLPQVAGKGKYHFRVSKLVGENGRTQTIVSELELDERINEIARLMSGDTITEGARSNAKTLMN
jgi:DNA repair protein RecN (Recombination protein N)